MNELIDYKQCENLLSIHLCDLGLNFNKQVHDEVMDVFRIQTKQDTIQCCKGNLHVAFKIFIERIHGGRKYMRENAEKFKYVQIMKQALNQEDTLAPLDKQ